MKKLFLILSFVCIILATLFVLNYFLERVVAGDGVALVKSIVIFAVLFVEIIFAVFYTDLFGKD